MKCKNCGAELDETAKFCSYCGAKIITLDEPFNDIPDMSLKPEHPYTDDQEENQELSYQKHLPGTRSRSNTKQEPGKEAATGNALIEKLKSYTITFWNALDLFGKIACACGIISVLVLLIAALTGNMLAIFTSIFVICILIAAILMRKGIIKASNKRDQYIILVAALVFAVLSVASVFTFKREPETGNAKSSSTSDTFWTPAAGQSVDIDSSSETADTSESGGAETNYTIPKDRSYAYMSDEWNVYIATVISESVIKVENWNKTLSSTKRLSYNKDIGTFRLNDSETGFSWVDDNQTAFTFILQDKDNSRIKKPTEVVFTLCSSNSDVCKGTAYDEHIACYSFKNDDWHMYRVIPLTDTLVKFECWSRSSSIDDFLFGWDVGVLDTENASSDFEWADDERTACTITMKDPYNKYYWKDAIFVSYVLENPDYKYSNVLSFVNQKSSTVVVQDDETQIPKAAYSYKYKNFNDVQKELSDTGFTNITFQVLYDIVWGWTDEGEVKSVTIDGKADFEKGDIFKKDAPVVITYHMKEENDPNKTVEEEESETVEEALQDDEARIPQDAYSYILENYRDVQKELSDAGFTNITFKILYDIVWGLTDEGDVKSVSVDGKTDFEKGEVFKKDAPIVITYHMMEEDDPNKPVATEAPKKVEGDDINDKPASFSTNTFDEAKKGNSGKFAYKDRGSNYYIIDFDEGYVYHFMDGNGETFCDRLKIESGDLNSVLIITYHDGDMEWSNGLHFKYVNQPDHMIMEDQNHYEWDYYTTNLDDALKKRSSKTITDY